MGLCIGTWTSPHLKAITTRRDSVIRPASLAPRTILLSLYAWAGRRTALQPPISAILLTVARRGSRPHPRRSAGSSSGNIAVSTDGNAWVWTPDRSETYITRDRGVSWTLCAGLPASTRIIADPVRPAQVLWPRAVRWASLHQHRWRRDVRLRSR